MPQTVVTKKQPKDHQPKQENPSKRPPIIDVEDEAEPIPVRLVGVEYEAHRPKAMLAIRLGEQIQSLDLNDTAVAAETLGEFLRLMFGTDTANAIMERLEDPDDALDIHHLLKFVMLVTEYVTERPPM